MLGLLKKKDKKRLRSWWADSPDLEMRESLLRLAEECELNAREKAAGEEGGGKDE